MLPAAWLPITSSRADEPAHERIEADVAVSDDGAMLVYAAAADVGKPDQRAEIWAMNADGSQQRRAAGSAKDKPTR